jgi:hypothetical protein
MGMNAQDARCPVEAFAKIVRDVPFVVTVPSGYYRAGLISDVRGA